MHVEHVGHFCSLHHIIDATNNFPLDAKQHHQIEPQVTSDIKMVGEKLHRINVYPLHCTLCLTQSTLLSHPHLISFTLC